MFHSITRPSPPPHPTPSFSTLIQFALAKVSKPIHYLTMYTFFRYRQSFFYQWYQCVDVLSSILTTYFTILDLHDISQANSIFSTPWSFNKMNYGRYRRIRYLFAYLANVGTVKSIYHCNKYSYITEEGNILTKNEGSQRIGIEFHWNYLPMIYQLD